MTLRQAALESENATLRGLTSAMPEVIEKRLIGEVINVEVSTLRQRLLVNRGGNSGVYRAQPVITGDGVLGQVFRIGPFSSEDHPHHRFRARAARCRCCAPACAPSRSAPAAATALDLPYVPQNYDVKVGDVLVTSGLDGVFPFGLPVGRVTRVERDPTQPLAQIVASPLARIESDREVLFIWARPGHPAAPASAEALAVEAPKPARAAETQTETGTAQTAGASTGTGADRGCAHELRQPRHRPLKLRPPNRRRSQPHLSRAPPPATPPAEVPST